MARFNYILIINRKGKKYIFYTSGINGLAPFGHAPTFLVNTTLFISASLLFALLGSLSATNIITNNIIKSFLRSSSKLLSVLISMGI